MLFQKKTLTIPSSEVQTIEAVRSWTVEWMSRHGQFSSDVKNRYEVFTDEEAGRKFAASLRNAFDLLKYTHGTEVKLYENK